MADSATIVSDITAVRSILSSSQGTDRRDAVAASLLATICAKIEAMPQMLAHDVAQLMVAGANADFTDDMSSAIHRAILQRSRRITLDRPEQDLLNIQNYPQMSLWNVLEGTCTIDQKLRALVAFLISLGSHTPARRPSSG